METLILNQIQNQEISASKGYKLLYPRAKQRKLRRAHFIKLRIDIPGEKGVNRFLKVLFFFPMPLFIAKLGLRFVKNSQLDHSGLSKQDLAKLISYRGIRVDVTTSSKEKILIKTI